MRNYSVEEIEFLKENYNKMSNSELAKDLDRSPDGISHKLKELGLLRKANPEPYSEEEVKFIKENIGKMTVTDIARSINRSQSGVSKFITKKRISNVRKRKKIYLENIDDDVPPIYSKGEVYFETIERLKINESFSYPHADRYVVNNQKYLYVNQCQESGKRIPVFISRKTGEEDGIQMRRMWRIA